MNETSRGMTLIELMIVVAIIGVMGSVAVWAMGGISNSNNPAALARRMQFFVQKAHSEAVGDNFQRQISCGNTRCTYAIATTPGYRTGKTFVLTGETVQAGKFAQIWNIAGSTDVATDNSGSSAMATTKTMTFYPDGTADASTVYVCDTAATKGHFFKVYVYSGTGLARLVSVW